MSSISSADSVGNSNIKFDEKFVIKLLNKNNKFIIERDAKENCKILQISSELDIDQKLTIISALEPSEYPNLFIFIIKEQNLNILKENQGTKAKQLEESLSKFGAARPLIIQQICEAQNETKFYYKAENSSEIVDIDQHYSEDCELYEKWQNILSNLDGRELQPFEDEMLKKLSCIEDLSITLRFSRTLNLPEAFFETPVKIVAMTGSKADLLAVLDAQFEDNGRILNNQAQNYIRYVFEDDESGSESDEVESTSKKASDEELDSPIDGTSTKNEDSSQSVLLTAVQHSNQEIIDYLVTYWTHLIQELPVEHQIRISTAAFENNQLDILCDLLECSDFPFPNDFNNTKDQLSHDRLQNIITDRIKFHEVIEQENYKEINNFINNNLSLKFIYSPQNLTAMKKAIDSQKYKIYYYLKSFGLCASEFNSLDQVLDEKELSKANDQAYIQKTESISDALRHASKSVLILCTRSLIHNRKVKKEDEIKYRKYIKKWLEDVNKIAQIMLDVAASCENLVIVFDFESKFVDRTAFRDNALGLSSDTVSSRIFIGSKLGDNKREQEIKGVLAHELCHYVMSLVYDNKFLPYYKYSTDIRDIFDGIVKSIDKWSSNDPEPPNDECNGVISSVFRYKKEQFNLELIVRAVQILVLYADDSEKSAYLQEKYKNLFDFWFNQVIPELHKYLHKNKVVIRINTTVELLSSLAKTKIEFTAPKDVEQLSKNRIIIVTTNVPKLLLITIHKHLQVIFGCLLDSQNVFLEPEKIKNEQVWKDLMHLYTRNVKLNIFVDCTKEKFDNLSSILRIEEFRLILVASDEEQSTRLNEICIKKEINPSTVDINYNWSDLTEESQIMLIQSKITFQNNSKISLMELLSKNTNPDKNEVEKILKDFSNIINDQVFNMIIEKQGISVNSKAEDSKNTNFEILFRNRVFLKKGINFKNEISQEKLISIMANNKHVLISDIAGSGKSWVVKNISKIIKKHDPTRWVTYVDLKQFIEEFKKQTENFEFENYFIENILKLKTKFEEEIFKKLYKNGKVSIIFDAFDEIAPDCAEFVADLAKSFEFNDGNQLWIVTRDYFEVNLQNKLEIENVYKLNEFTEEDGINFIVASWILMDIKDKINKDFDNCLQNSPNLTKYQEKAKGIVQKVSMSKNQSIGLPQLFSMIADGYKDDKIILDDLKGAKIFTRFVQTMYTRWLKNGQLREDANAVSLDYEMNFKEFHQYCALLSLFPELVDSLFPDYDKSEWPEVEVIAGGLMNKIGSSYSFIHETFREYFVADFIFKAVKKPKIKEEIYNLLVKVLTIQKYGIIRMFLNDFIDNFSVMEKIQLELEKYVEKFNSLENLSEYFTENQEQLAEFVVKILKNGEYEKVKKIISDNISAVATKTKELKMFSIFAEFLLSYLKVEDLKDMTNKQNILQKMIGSEADAAIFEYFVEKLEEEVGKEFIQQELKLMPSGPKNGNIFYNLGSSQNLFKKKVQKCFEIFQKYLNNNEIINLMNKCTKDEETILEILARNPMNFKPFFDGAESFFANKDSIQKFKKIVNKIDSIGRSILHCSVSKESMDYHTTLWTLILKTFENRHELGIFVLTKNNLEINFLHCIIIFNKPKIIEFTFKKLKENLNESDYHEILRSKGQFGRNLLQFAAVATKEVKNHQIIWQTLHASCKSNEEFLEILTEVDNEGDNVFNLAATFTTAEVLELMEKELEKFATLDEIRKLLIKLGLANKNLLQAAALQNKSLEFHKILWKIIKKYFNSSEILEFIKNCNICGDNLLINVIEKNTKEIAELTWKEVKKVLNITEDHKINIEKCEKIMNNNSEPKELEKDEIEILKLKWIKNENLELFEENLKIDKIENLIFFVADENVKNHEKLWENLSKFYKTSADLKKLLFEENKIGNNFIHNLVSYNTADVIEFTINKFKEYLNESDYHEIIKSKGQFDRNLLQRAAFSSKEVKIHQFLWKEVRDSCKSDAEFLEILEQVDEDGNSFLNITTSQVLQFMEEELAKVASRDKIRNFLIKLRYGNRNLLQTASENKSLEVHKTLWRILQKYFNSSEMLEFVKHLDINGNNSLVCAKKWSSKEVLELTWMEVEKVIATVSTDTEFAQKIKECEEIIQKIVKNIETITNDEIELLKLKWINFGSSNLFDKNILTNNLNVQTLKDLEPFILNNNLHNHEILWKHLLKTFKNREDLMKLLFEKYENGSNFIQLLSFESTADVIEFTLNKLKMNLIESGYHEILRSKGQFGRNLLQLAINSKKVKTHQILWTIFRDSFKSNEEFLEYLAEVDNDGSNVLNHAAAFTTNQIFEFMQKELEKFASLDKIRKLFINLGFKKRNLLQSAARQNKSVELNEVVWETVEKYFSSSEILKFIKHFDVFGHNLLLNAIIGDTKEVMELTWKKVRKIIITVGYESNDNFKKCDEIMKKDVNFDKLTKEEEEILKLDWIDCRNSDKLFEDNIPLLIQKDISVIVLDDLIPFMTDANIENHVRLWKYLEENFKSYEDLRKLIFENDKNGNKYVHLLVFFNSTDIIEFTLKKHKEYLNESDYQEILRSKGQFGSNLFHFAALFSKELKTHQFLWKTLQTSCKSNEEILEILTEFDEKGRDVFHIAAAITSNKVFEFMMSELEKLTNDKEIRQILTSFEVGNKNLLQSLTTNNKSLESNETVWKIIRKYFDDKEILEFIEHCNDSGNNLLCNAVYWNTKEIVEFTWNQIANFINTKDAQIEYLSKKGQNRKSLHQLSLENQSNDSQVAVWVSKTTKLFNIHSVKSIKDLIPFMKDENVENHEKLWKNLNKFHKTSADLKKLLLEKNKIGNNFVHLIVSYNTTYVIEFTFKKLKENLNESDYQEILRSKGQKERNLLQIAAFKSKEIKIHQILWQELQDFCKSDEEFLEILRQVNEQGSNVFHIAAACTSSEVFEFIISELERHTNDKEIRFLLSSFGKTNTNLLQSVVIGNKSLEANKTVWKIIYKYFEPKEILEFIEYCDKDDDNLICNAVFWNTKEIVEFTWNQIKNFINTKDAQVEYLSRKGHKNKSLHQLSLENKVNDSQVADWVQQIMQD